MKPYYDTIARKWHALTGSQGGALKKLVLNEIVLSRIRGIGGSAILELGAGNGYFLPLVMRRFSGQVPTRVVITDQSPVMLDLAKRHFQLADAEYRLLDVRAVFPFSDESFHLIVANMVFNEITAAGLRRALAECARTLALGGRLLATVTHPAFVESLQRRGQLKPLNGGLFTMPGSDGLRLPVVPRSLGQYQAALEKAGLRFRIEELYPTDQILRAKPGLRQAGNIPIALILECEKPETVPNHDRPSSDAPAVRAPD